VDDAEVKLLSEAYEARVPRLKEVSVHLEDLARQGLARLDHEHIDRVSFRAKSAKSFVGKVVKRAADADAGVERDGFALRPYSSPLTQVEDQIGGRVVVLFKHDIPPVLELLTPDTFNVVEMQDKTPPKDAEFGYESAHLVCHIPEHVRPADWASDPSMPATFELQVRTLFMHAWAEPQHNLGYKSPIDLSRDQKRHLAWIAASAWGCDDGMERAWRDIGVARTD